MANYPGDYTPSFALIKPIVGGDSGTWGTELNGGVMAALDTILGSTISVSITTVDVTLTTTQFQNMAFIATGVLTGNRALQIPLNNVTSATTAAVGKFIVYNNTGGNFTLTVKTAVSTSAGVTVGQGQIAQLWSNGVDVMYDNTALPASVRGVSGTPQGQLAGTAASVNTNASLAADYLNGALYLCTQSGTAASALWSNVSGLQYFLPQNAAITASVSGNRLTVAIIAASTNTTPSTGNPVIIPFGDSTLTAGDIATINVTGSLSLTTNVGATLGTIASTSFRFWLGVFNGTGTAYLGIVNCLAGNIIYPLDESIPRTTIAIGGSSTSAGQFYTDGIALTNKPFRLIGYIEYSGGLVTPGTYNTSPTALRLFGPGVKKPGDVVQISIARLTALLVANGTVIPFTDAIPTTSVGTAVMSTSVTAINTVNMWEIEAHTNFQCSSQNGAVCYLIQNTAAASTNAIVTDWTSGTMGLLTPAISYQVSTTSLTTFSMRVGGDVGGNFFINGKNATTRVYGGSAMTYIKITERMG